MTKSSVRIRLSAMMFLEYAIWGAWAPFLWQYLVGKAPDPGLGMSDPQAAFIFGLIALACILAPFTGGQIADRWVSTEKFLGVAHLVGGAALIVMAKAQGFYSVVVLMSIYCLMFAPTLALTNSLGFHHIGDEKEFGKIRVFGTLGWIFAAFVLSALRKYEVVPGGVADCVMLAGVFAVILGVFSFFLPHTPPAKEDAADPLAFREAFVLLKNKNFLVFMMIAFVVTTELQFYYGPTAEFLEQALKIPHASIPIVMAVAQAAELIAMAFVLKYALRKWGVRKTLALGTIAWPLRYIVFAAAPYGPLAIMKPLVIASLTLHGLGYTFFFVASQVYVDMVAPKDIRASAQSLLTLVTLGIGTWLGTIFTGYIKGVFAPSVTNLDGWTKVFLVPCALTITCAIAFLLFFKDARAEARVDSGT